jgi:DNA-binding transcriptional regulator YhcF (GntR family)
MTRTETVMAAIRARIAGRMLNAGDRLPSIRRLAGAMGVSPRRWWRPMTGWWPRG